MPDDRFFHRRACHSKKVTGLTDLEFRVWWTYELCADDYGVMRCSAAALRSGNDAFEEKPPTKTLERAFARLVDAGLLQTFAHQGKPYVFQRDWQEFQHIRNPRGTVNPLPPLESIEACEESTRTLFKNRLEFTGESTADDSNDAASTPRHSSRGRTRVTANGNGLPATGSSDLKDRFEQFWQRYPRKVGKGAAWRIWTRLRPEPELLSQMLLALEWQRTQAQWVKDGGQFIPHPQTWLNQRRWEDEPSDTPQIGEKTARTMGAIFGQ